MSDTPPPWRPQRLTLLIVLVEMVALFCLNWFPRGSHTINKRIDYEIYGFPFKIEVSDHVVNDSNEVVEEIDDGKGHKTLRVLGVGFSTFNFADRFKWYCINAGLCFMMLLITFGLLEFYLNLPPERRFNFSSKPRKTKLERIKEEARKKELARALAEAEALETKREMEALILASDTKVIKKTDDPTQKDQPKK